VDHKSITFTFAVDLFLLLLIGVGPKIALVPFLEITADMDDATKRRVARKMLTTAAKVSALLLVLGEVLRRLLHFSIGSLSVASGLILLVIAVAMVLSPGNPEKLHQRRKGQDPMQLAVFPLAVPYVVNPAGIVALMTLSAEAASVAVFALAAGLAALVLALDVAVFRWANRVSDHVDESRMLVTEKVFGFLLAALAVQLVLNGLDDVGVIHLGQH
jgi:multiple antibiotic resistance protein